MSIGGWVFMGLIMIMAAAEGMLFALVLVGGIAFLVCRQVVRELQKCSYNICNDVERIMRQRVLAITNKEVRRKAERELEQQLVALHERYRDDKWGFTQMSYVLGGAMVAWPLLGIAAIGGIAIGSRWFTKVNVNHAVKRMQETLEKVKASVTVDVTAPETVAATG